MVFHANLTGISRQLIPAGFLWNMGQATCQIPKTAALSMMNPIDMAKQGI